MKSIDPTLIFLILTTTADHTAFNAGYRGGFQPWAAYWCTIIIFGMLKWRPHCLHKSTQLAQNAGNPNFEDLNFKISLGSMPPDPQHCIPTLILKTFMHILYENKIIQFQI